MTLTVPDLGPRVPTGERVDLPSADGTFRTIEVLEPVGWPTRPEGSTSRRALAAAHVAADPFGDNVPGAPAAVDWDATLAFRRHLFSYGFGVAEAMDTAQRGMGLDWPAVQELVRRSAEQAADLGARIASGVGTDHRPDAASLDEVVAAYTEQAAFVESTGSEVVLMCSRQLAATARTADDYRAVYDRVLGQVSRPVVLHWLGEAFDPALRGYWGSTDVATATDVFVDLLHDHAARVDGVKVSLLSAEHEVALRTRLPEGVSLYTGDDFHYPELIRGDGERHSDALLGALAAIAPRASAALERLDAGDLDGYDAAMDPTLALSRHVFGAPTFHYKVGIAFLAWLDGHQRGFTMVGGLQSARGAVHLARAFELANEAGTLRDPLLAADRVRRYLDLLGASR